MRIFFTVLLLLTAVSPAAKIRQLVQLQGTQRHSSEIWGLVVVGVAAAAFLIVLYFMNILY